MSLSRIYREQRNTSQNLGESWPRKSCRAFWAVVYLFRAVMVGLRGMRRERLGERVIVDGTREAWICNWAGDPFPNVAGEEYYEQHVDRARIKTVGGLQKYLHRFRVMFDWYAISWHGIAVNKRVYPAAFVREGVE